MLRAAQAITGREKQGQSLPAPSDAEGTTLVASRPVNGTTEPVAT